MQFIQHFKQERGAGIVEYGLIVALIAIVSLTTVGALGASTSETLSSAGNDLKHADTDDTGSTTTTDPTDLESTTTTLPSGYGSDPDDSDDSAGAGGAGETTTTTAAPEVTTTTAPDYPTKSVGVEGEVIVTYSYVDSKVVVVDTETNGDWTMEVTKEKDSRIDLTFTNSKTNRTIETRGWVTGKGDLKTKLKTKDAKKKDR